MLLIAIVPDIFILIESLLDSAIESIEGKDSTKGLCI